MQSDLNSDTKHVLCHSDSQMTSNSVLMCDASERIIWIHAAQTKTRFDLCWRRNVEKVYPLFGHFCFFPWSCSTSVYTHECIIYTHRQFVHLLEKIHDFKVVSVLSFSLFVQETALGYFQIRSGISDLVCSNIYLGSWIAEMSVELRFHFSTRQWSLNSKTGSLQNYYSNDKYGGLKLPKIKNVLK